jgi:hypothetical protein
MASGLDVSGHFMAIKHHPELIKNLINCSPMSVNLGMEGGSKSQYLLKALFF